MRKSLAPEGVSYIESKFTQKAAEKCSSSEQLKTLGAQIYCGRRTRPGTHNVGTGRSACATEEGRPKSDRASPTH
jgi:hypothetical protein